MMKAIPYILTLACSGLLLTSCMGGGAAPTGRVPQTLNPAGAIPEVKVWAGGTSLVMGVDSACSVPVAVFPTGVSRCKVQVSLQDGKEVLPVGISWKRGQTPVVASGRVVGGFNGSVQGLVGWPLAKRFAWHLQLAQKRHAIAETIPADVREWDSLPMEEAPVAKVVLPGCGECILDTGAPFGLYLSQEEWRRFLAAHPEAKIGTYYGSSPSAGGEFCRQYTQVDQVRLGPLCLRNIRVCESFSEKTGPRMLGREALSQFELWVDGPARRLYYRAEHR